MERILWAVKVGDPDWKEVLITNDESQFDAAKTYFSKIGYDRFRVAEIDLSIRPDFKKTVKKMIY